MPKFSLVFIIFIYFVAVMGAKSGPYKVMYTRVEPCSRPTQPVDEHPQAAFYAEMYNTTTETNLLRGNITVYKDHKIKKMSAKSYLKIRNKWKVNYVMDNFGCNRVLFPIIATAVGLPFDAQTCGVFKGVYEYSNFNANKIQHGWMRTQEYGAVLWRFEVFSAAGSVFCYELETLISPADQ